MTDPSTPPPPVSVRPATPEDLPFLVTMLVEATNWDGTRPASPTSVARDPQAWHYVEGWQRPTDFGVVAVDGDHPVGAAWARFLPSEDAGYGYVEDSIPELTLGVTGTARHRGFGRRLLDELVASARDRGLAGLSLSVEDGNAPARALYEKAGFEVVGRNGGSDTMLLRIPR